MLADRYVEKERTWKDNWNNIVRHVFFKDEKLREYMMIPENCTVTRFVDKYFLEDNSAGEIITDEAVRVICYDEKGILANNSKVMINYKEFDIYVKDNVLHTATRDRIQNRYDLIAERLRYLLTRQKVVEHMSFRFEDEFNLWTKTAGYKRFHVVFSYKTTA